MVHKKGKRNLIIAGAIALVIVIAIGVVLLVSALQPKESDPYRQITQSSTEDTKPVDTPDTTDTDKQDDDAKTDTNTGDSTSSTLDPASVATIDIQPMEISAAYVRGAGGFEYSVLRTSSGTQYVEFSSPELKGTKCTEDNGAFASILANPSTNESATLNKTVTVGGVKYGLSLADETCTKDAALLKQYQAAFSDAFGLLKKL